VSASDAAATRAPAAASVLIRAHASRRQPPLALGEDSLPPCQDGNLVFPDETLAKGSGGARFRNKVLLLTRPASAIRPNSQQ